MNTANDKLVIAVDIDDVIAASAPAFVAYSNEKYGTHLTVDDYQEHWGELWKVESDEVIKRAHEYHESRHHATYEIIDGALEVLKKLKKHFKLVVLTTRRNSINQLTREWVDKFYPDIFDDFVFTGFFDNPKVANVHGDYQMTKAKLAQDIGATYLIDDQLKHILASAEIGIRGLLFGDYLWNKTDSLPANVIRVKNWEEILKYFEKEIDKNIKRKYSFSEYNPNWESQFYSIRDFLTKVFDDKAIRIEHVGSTSVEGMKAKPLIDLLVVVKKMEPFQEQKDKMTQAGYEWRENYIAPNSLLFFRLGPDGEKLDNIHVCEENSPKARQFIVMRDYLRMHPEKARIYSDLKQKNAELYPDDYPAYRKAKDLFLQQLEKEAYEWAKTQ